MSRKGRAATGDRNGSRLYPDRMKRGELARSAKLTEQKVLEIRSRRARGQLLKDIALDYGITLQTVHAVVSRQSWRHV